MASTQLTNMVRQLRRSVQVQSGLTDGELLDAYRTNREPADWISRSFPETLPH